MLYLNNKMSFAAMFFTTVSLVGCDDSSFKSGGPVNKSVSTATLPKVSAEAAAQRTPAAPEVPQASVIASTSSSKLECKVTSNQAVLSPTLKYAIPGSEVSIPSGIDKKTDLNIEATFPFTRVTIDDIPQTFTGSVVQLYTSAYMPEAGSDTKNITLKVFDAENNFATCGVTLTFAPMVVDLKLSSVEPLGEKQITWMVIDLSMANLLEAASIDSIKIEKLSTDFKALDCKKMSRKELPAKNGTKLFQDSFRCAVARRHSIDKALGYKNTSGNLYFKSTSGTIITISLPSIDSCVYTTNAEVKKENQSTICSSANPNFIGNILPTDSALNHGAIIYPEAFPTDAELKTIADQLVFSAP